MARGVRGSADSFDTSQPLLAFTSSGEVNFARRYLRFDILKLAPHYYYYRAVSRALHTPALAPPLWFDLRAHKASYQHKYVATSAHHALVQRQVVLHHEVLGKFLFRAHVRTARCRLRQFMYHQLSGRVPAGTRRLHDHLAQIRRFQDAHAAPQYRAFCVAFMQRHRHHARIISTPISRYLQVLIRIRKTQLKRNSIKRLILDRCSVSSDLLLLLDMDALPFSAR